LQGVVVTEDVHVGVLMFVANRSAETRVLEAVRRGGYHDLTVAQARIAARIAPGGTRLGELAEQAQISKQTATHLVDQMERGGYVERTVDPTDGRGRLVRFTKRGLEVIKIARAEEARIDAEWKAHLGERRMRQLREALSLLREITDPYA
jgi:DNA-binding MarR family transcriptional regulator